MNIHSLDQQFKIPLRKKMANLEDYRGRLFTRLIKDLVLRCATWEHNLLYWNPDVFLLTSWTDSTTQLTIKNLSFIALHVIIVCTL